MTNFSKVEIAQLPDIISEGRFSPYLRETGGVHLRALKLYRWNMLISAAFLFPIGATEVTLRNAIVDAVRLVYGEDSLFSNRFLESIPDNSRLPRAIQQYNDLDTVVTKLNLQFWGKMLGPPHDTNIWQAHFETVFPYAPTSASIVDLCSKVEKLRYFRNDVAHHEPIWLQRDLVAELNRMDSIVRWRSPVKADWMKKTHGVFKLLAEDPRQGP